MIEEYIRMDAGPVVFVVDNDPAICKSLRWLIESIGLRVQVCESAQYFLDTYNPEIGGCMILDVRMPGMSGLELQERLARNGIDLPIIMVTAYGDISTAVRAMKAGAIDFLEKPLVDQDLLDTIQRAIVRDADKRRCRDEKSEIVRRLNTLTGREREVLEFVVGGLSSRQIGTKLGVAGKTVESHRARIMRKMQAASIAELIRMRLLAESS